MQSIIRILCFMHIICTSIHAQNHTVNIGIMPFAGSDKNTAESVVSKLSAKLSKFKFIRLVEQSKLKELIKEIKWGSSGLADIDSAAKAGKVQGLEIMITGAIRESKIFLRVIHTKTGRIIASHEGFLIKYIDEMSRELASGIETYLARENLKSMRNNSPKIRMDFHVTGEKSGKKIKKKMKMGETIIFHFKANQNGYLTIVDIQPDGNIVILFPSDFSWDNKIIKNKKYNIPEQENKFEIRVAAPAGLETIVALFTKIKIDWLDRNKIESKGFWIIKEYEKYNLTMRLRNSVEGLKKSEWETKVLEVKVVE